MHTLYHGNCLDVLPTLPAQSVDAIICDLPYGTTACKWDTVIPFAPMWEQVKRVIKARGAVVFFAAQPFTSALVMSNPTMFRQEIVWDKVLPVGFLDANRRHLRRHENILLFSIDGYTTFNPQKTSGQPYSRPPKALTPVYNNFVPLARVNETGDRFPTSIVAVSNANKCKDSHPTQKPVELLRYLVRTYTNPGETVLDFCFGSCTTGVACLLENRNFIGIEKEANYFEIGSNRMEKQRAEIQNTLFSCDTTDTSKSDCLGSSLPQALEMFGKA